MTPIQEKLREILQECVAYYANGGDFKPEPAIEAIMALVVSTIPAERNYGFLDSNDSIGYNQAVTEMLETWTEGKA